MNTTDIAAWLDASGGYTAVYRDRLERLRPAKDKAEVRYNRYLKMPSLEDRQIPNYLSGFEGEVLISAKIDRITGLLSTRSVWQPKGRSFWYSHLDKFVAARPPSTDGANRTNVPDQEPSSRPVVGP
jgi:hypothetical protein